MARSAKRGSTGSRVSGKAGGKSVGKSRTKGGGGGGGFGKRGGAWVVGVIGGVFGAMFGDRRRATRTLSGVATAVLVCGVVVGMVFGRGPLRKVVASSFGDEVSVRFDWPTDDRGVVWIGEAERLRIERGVLDRLNDPVLDEQGRLERAHAWLAGTGWLDRLVMRRGAGGEVRVRGVWRMPYAEVRQERAGAVWVVDGDGVPIDTANAWALPRIVGVRFSPLGSSVVGEGGLREVYGYPWGTGEVEAGIALLKSLKGVKGSEQIVGVDVSGFTSDPPELVLLSDRAYRIRWGGPVGAPNPAEPDDARKVAMLKRLVELTGRIDGDKPMLDLRTGRIEIDRTSSASNASAGSGGGAGGGEGGQRQGRPNG